MSLLDVEVIAHRGASHAAPENTLAAAALARDEGADAVEVDVRLTRDGRIAVIHDADTRRVAGTPHVVAESDFAALRRLDVGSWKGERWRGEPIPELGELVAAHPPGMRLFVEVKCGVEIHRPLVELLQSAGPVAVRIVVISYDLEVLRGIKAAFPELTVLLVARFEPDGPGGHWTPSIDSLIAAARDAGLDGLNLKERGPLDVHTAHEIRWAGLTLYVWTVDDPVRARELIALGARGITTNRPGWLRSQLVAAA